jgi:hypothetical protein
LICAPQDDQRGVQKKKSGVSLPGCLIERQALCNERKFRSKPEPDNHGANEQNQTGVDRGISDLH